MSWLDSMPSLQLEDTRDFVLKTPDGKPVFAMDASNKKYPKAWTVRIRRVRTDVVQSYVKQVTRNVSSGLMDNDEAMRQMVLFIVVSWSYGPVEFSRETLSTLLNNERTEWFGTWCWEQASNDANFMSATSSDS